MIAEERERVCVCVCFHVLRQDVITLTVSSGCITCLCFNLAFVEMAERQTSRIDRFIVHDVKTTFEYTIPIAQARTA